MFKNLIDRTMNSFENVFCISYYIFALKKKAQSFLSKKLNLLTIAKSRYELLLVTVLHLA